MLKIKHATTYSDWALIVVAFLVLSSCGGPSQEEIEKAKQEEEEKAARKTAQKITPLVLKEARQILKAEIAAAVQTATAKAVQKFFRDNKAGWAASLNKGAQTQLIADITPIIQTTASEAVQAAVSKALAETPASTPGERPPFTPEEIQQIATELTPTFQGIVSKAFTETPASTPGERPPFTPEEIQQIATELTPTFQGIVSKAFTETPASTPGERPPLTPEEIQQIATELTPTFQGIVSKALAETPATTPLTEQEQKARIITDITTDTRKITQDTLVNSSSFLNDKIKRIANQTIQEISVNWEDVVSEDDKDELTRQIINGIQEKLNPNDLKNIIKGIKHNAWKMVNGMSVTIPIALGLKGEEIRKQINTEMESTIKVYIDDFIAHIAGHIVDANTATEAIFTLQFDINASPVHYPYGTLDVIAVKINNKEDSSQGKKLSYRLETKGNCVRIKNEWLPKIELIKIYATPLVNMVEGSLPHKDGFHYFCSNDCMPGHYNIQITGQDNQSGIDHVLKWAKPNGESPSDCPIFPQ